MSPSLPDSDRWLELAQEMGERIGHVVRDVVPPDAAGHLLNAQRELLTALLLIYEHQAASRRTPPATARRNGAGRRSRTSRTRSVNRINVD